ncbi:MAG: hypothetical protein JXR10_12315 [Cyclobacteriaceae bacterium]
MRRYSLRYANKNDSKAPLEINQSNWVRQGVKAGIITYVIFLLFTMFMGHDLPKSALMASPFFLLGFSQAYFLRNKRANNKEQDEE